MIDVTYVWPDGYQKKDNKMKRELDPPRRRELNDDCTDDFVAIDFETMTGCRTSACAVGMVKVIDGEIVQQFYSLINPVRDKYTDREPNTRIHGISLETAEKAPTFEELFEGLRLFIGNLPLVCHNKSADIAIIDQLMEYYGLQGLDTSGAICTYQLTKKSLSDCCKEYGIKEDKHHNALWDAEVCARIYLELIGKPLIRQGGNVPPRVSDESKNVCREHRQRLSESAVENKDTIFYGATVVITGTFDKYPIRDDLAAKIQLLGGRICSSISKKTNIVLVGEGAGPKKIKTINEYKEQGISITILREHELVSILEYTSR